MKQVPILVSILLLLYYAIDSCAASDEITTTYEQNREIEWSKGYGRDCKGKDCKWKDGPIPIFVGSKGYKESKGTILVKITFYMIFVLF